MRKLMIWHFLLKHVKENCAGYSVTLSHWNSKWITTFAKISSNMQTQKRIAVIECDFNSFKLKLDNFIFNNVIECIESNSTIMAQSCVLMSEKKCSKQFTTNQGLGGHQNYHIIKKNKQKKKQPLHILAPFPPFSTTHLQHSNPIIS